MKRLHKRLVIAAAITIGLLPAAAAALDLTIPALLPDLCFVSCVTWTHSTTLLELENVLAAAENLKAAKNIGEVIAIVRGQIPAITAAADASPPMAQGTASSTTAAAQVPTVDAQITAAGNAAVACTGALCVEQAQAAQLATIASEAAKANALHAADVKQQAARDSDTVDHIVEESVDAEFPATSTLQ
jgi:hypothetical protein